MLFLVIPDDIDQIDGLPMESFQGVEDRYT